MDSVKNLNSFALKLLKERKNDKALLIYKYLCKIDFNIKNLVNYCKTLIASENKPNIVKAIKLLNDVIDEIKLHPEDLLLVKKMIGNAYCGLKEYDIARVFYENCLKINENDDLILSNIGISYHLEQQNTKALEYFYAALILKPKNVQALSSTALVYFNLKNYTECFNYLNKAFEIESENLVVINLFCKLYFENHINFNLKDYLEKYLKHDSLNQDLLYLYAVVLFKEQDYIKSELELLKIILINPGHQFANELMMFLKNKKSKNKTIEGCVNWWVIEFYLFV